MARRPDAGRWLRALFDRETLFDTLIESETGSRNEL